MAALNDSTRQVLRENARSIEAEIHALEKERVQRQELLAETDSALASRRAALAQINEDLTSAQQAQEASEKAAVQAQATQAKGSGNA